MGMTFDATLKEMGRDSPEGFLKLFDAPPEDRVKLLNVDLSTVTRVADLILGIGEPLKEIIHLDFQASAAAWKHLDLMVYNALIHGHFRVPVHTLLVLLRPTAAHSNMTGSIRYAPRPTRGSMDFSYEIVRLWEIPANDLLKGDLGITPLALLGKLPPELSLEEGLERVAHQLVDRLVREAGVERVQRLLTDAFLLCGLRVRRDVARRIFQGVRAMQESDTYLMILDEGQEKALKKALLAVGEERFGPIENQVKEELEHIADLERLERMHRRAVKAANWQEILETL